MRYRPQFKAEERRKVFFFQVCPFVMVFTKVPVLITLMKRQPDQHRSFHLSLSPMDYTAENLRLLATGICGKWFSTEAAIVLV